MKRVIFKTSGAVANQGGAMEVDTILKNGRSSKSQMSRENFLKFIGVLFVASLIFVTAGCDKDKEENDNGVVKLLETITYEDGDYTKFEYDNQNRITKMSFYWDGKLSYTDMFTYIGNDLTKMVFSNVDYPEENREIIIVKNGNTIAWDGDITLTVNGDGFLTKYDDTDSDGDGQVITFQYQGGNLTKYMSESKYDDERSEWEAVCKYDDKKSPLYHCKTPKWFLTFAFTVDGYIGINNNVTEVKSDWRTIKYSYIYDDDGFPTKITEEQYEDDRDKRTKIIILTYK